MKKKLFSLLLCGTMVSAMLAGCGEKTEAPAATTTEPTTTTEATGTIPTDYKYYFSLDQANDSAAISPTEKSGGALNAIEKEKHYIPGVKGDALYTDGITGYKLTDVNGVGNSYTVSYWTYCRRSALYMPNTIWGPDIHGDHTGGELWAAFDWLNSEDGSTQAFPCVWSNDGLGAGRAEWTIAENDSGVGRWMHLAMVVDENSVSADGLYNVAKVYIDGKEYTKKSGGEVVPTHVVKGAMNPAEGFEFCLGINYWDSVFKGAFDELYIYDYALKDEQVAALYADGNPTVAYQEPERVINVAAAENAIASLGKTDFSVADAVYAEDISIADGQTMQVKLKHWSDGKDAKDNYYIIFKAEDGSEVARVNADCTGTAGGKDIPEANFKWTWGNWKTWTEQAMVEADVKLLIERVGDTFNVTMDNVDYNTFSNLGSVSFDCANVASFTIGTTKAYTDILEIKEKVLPTGGIAVGANDCTSGFWTEFSDIFAIPEGQSVTKSFTNYTSGAENWNNFVAILQNTPTGHSATDVAEYAEYAVVRADNWGWGAGYDGIAVAECDWNWDTFKSDMDGAHVILTITNNGDTADVVAEVTTKTGSVYHQKYTGIKTGGDLYACFTVDGSYISIDSVLVGATDCTTPFWTQFSDIYAVPQGTSKTVYLKNYTSGAENWNNFVAILQNTPDAHAAASDADYVEYGVVRADNWGWGAGYDGIAVAECDWNWDTFKSDMDGAYVALTVTNNGDTADVKAVVTTVEGKVYNQSYTGIKTGGDLYFCLTVDGSYFMIEGTQVGNSECTDGFWTKFSPIYAVEKGTTVTKTLRNFTSGAENWNNFVTILQNTPTGHSATDVAEYAEYGVVRADNWGWGAGYDGIATAECDWNWDTFKADMSGATAVVSVTNNGDTADVTAVVTTLDGKVYHQKYTGIKTGGDLYFCFTVDGSSVVIEN